MERFTVKKVIYMLFATIFLFVLTQTVKVEAFEDDFFSVERIDGLVYGEPISKAKIILGEDCVAGTVSFMHPDRVANTVGPVSVWVTFAPEDSDTYGEPFSLPIDAVVEKRSIEIVFAAPIYKHYDGTDEVVLPGYEYQGILKQDENKISIDGALVGKYSGTYVAEEVPIVLSGISLSGEKKDCYELILTGHSGRIHPTQIRDFLNEVSIGFDNTNFLDISTTVTVKKNSPIITINDEYTSFLEYRFVVYDHNFEEINVAGKYAVGLTIKQEILSKERLEVFECLSDDVCKKLNYTYNNGVMYFEMDPDSKIIFTTRNVEYDAIMLFCGVLVVSFVSVVIYWIANITKSYASEEDEE